jgi:CheY-like chemotaxis protein
VDKIQPPRKPLRVLVVDDDPDAAGSLTLLLEALGYDVRPAVGGAEALHVAGEFRPEAAVLDLAMPHLDGCELAKRLRALPTPPRLLIAVSGVLDEDVARGAGFHHFFSKPVEASDLVAVFRTYEGRSA